MVTAVDAKDLTDEKIAALRAREIEELFYLKMKECEWKQNTWTWYLFGTGPVIYLSPTWILEWTCVIFVCPDYISSEQKLHFPWRTIFLVLLVHEGQHLSQGYAWNTSLTHDNLNSPGPQWIDQQWAPAPVRVKLMPRFCWNQQERNMLYFCRTWGFEYVSLSCHKQDAWNRNQDTE